jgi:omega-6 fatty acid desaturase (delta-12 desaturase)
MSEKNPSTLPADPRKLSALLARYRDPNGVRSTAEIVITALPLIGLWVTMWASLSISPWLCLLLSAPAAGFLVRLFMIQHDCSHGAFFRRRAANDWVGRAIGVLTLTPHDLWRRNHAIHHAGVGNLDQRGIGDVTTMTVREYLGQNWLQRLRYRLYRNPIVLFGIGPAYLFFIQHRLPLGQMRSGWQPWVSTMATNAAIALCVGLLIWALGVGPYLLIHLSTMLIAASIGVWLFYVQHQFEHTYWSPDADWKHPEASLHGSSYYHLPGVLRWLTANIGVHHVHHLNSRIPFYRLPEVLRDYPEFTTTGRLTILQSLRCVRLALWDESRRRLVSFRELRKNLAEAKAATASP